MMYELKYVIVSSNNVQEFNECDEMVDCSGTLSNLTSSKISGNKSKSIQPGELCNQALNYNHIEELKQDSMRGEISGHSIVNKLIENSFTFSGKTDFAQKKYIAKKLKKFSKTFVVKKCTSLSLMAHFSGIDRDRVMGLTVNSLSQMLNTANVIPGSKYIVIDATNGILLTSVYAKMNGNGNIFVLSDDRIYQPQMLEYLNLSSSDISKCVKHLPWSRIKYSPKEDVFPQQENSESYFRAKKRAEVIKETRAIFAKGGFNGLLVASRHNLIEIIDALTEFLAGSSFVVFFSQFEEPLIEPFVHLRSLKEYVGVDLFKVWTRKYKVPSSAGGMHPDIKAEPDTGYLLSAIRVLAN